MNYIEFTGKTVDEAVEKGLQELGLTKETAEIRVLEEGKKKLFGAVKARVEIAAIGGECKAEPCCSVPVSASEKTDGERAVEFLEGLFKLLKITACTELVSEGEKVEINVTAANTTSVIGKRGMMLDAIQTLAGAVANTGREDYKRVVVDCENYRENRETTLKKLAENLAQKAIRMEKRIKLEPMNPYERRIIHAALSEREGVSTQSEGKEPNRYIVVTPDGVDPSSPAIPARTERRNDRRGGSKGGYGNRDRGGFNRSKASGGFKKPYNRDKKGAPATGGTSMKASSDFFGIFLGNSGNSDDKE
ncbi:MAG: protein jag [Clostridia bacterium]|nr:protein jag [Clostridia bacterium]